MAKKIPPLTDSKCKAAKFSTGGKNRLFDGGGLYLELLPSSSKRWRLKYRRPITGKENILTFGPYPEIGLAAAREQREKAKARLSEGFDPGEAPPPVATGITFKTVADEWLETRRPVWSEGYFTRISNALAANVHPHIGQRSISSVTGKAVLELVQQVEQRGALEMAARVLEAVGMVFRYGCGTGLIQIDVTQGLRQFLQERPPVEHFPHVAETDLPALLASVERYHGRPETRLAIKLMMRTFPRTNELRWAQWSEIDWKNALWLIPGERMKGRLAQKQSAPDHIVPLSTQALAILESLRQHSGHFQYLFPNVHNRRGAVMSSDTMNRALKIMGYEKLQTGHGFRGLASTIMNEHSGFRPDAIERQLAHRDRNKVRRAYNHAMYLEERKKLMQWWSDYLDEQLEKAS
ncbi:tyrosine-type recombinase/integrase [Alcaligenes faecalis subsp. faecalis]|uniref:tyrosine-type recombinase/integrase n=1 Tax=Alcaligenes faecalis TaxID=511 RepID=UPI001F00A778|nr:integrase arm-type DNA-binding domain-containing protein [Alcaligenes faecalis]MBW4789174.1 tyrosine-type recombinase/integrase [Alcaligenes faecalis subsp. faecalis]